MLIECYAVQTNVNKLNLSCTALVSICKMLINKSVSSIRTKKNKLECITCLSQAQVKPKVLRRGAIVFKTTSMKATDQLY